MIRSRRILTLHGYPLFTWIRMETPVAEPVELPSEACFVYVLDGSGHALEPSGTLVAEPGRAILSLCGMTVGHMLSDLSQGYLDALVVHLDRDLLRLAFEGEKPDRWEELTAPVTDYAAQFAAGHLVRHYADGVVHLFENEAALTDDILRLKLKEIILLLLRSENSDSVRQIVRSLFSNRAFSFKELVEAHIESAASVHDLAMATNCSLSTFKRRFKHLYNTSPGRYMTDRKVERAAHLLATSDAAITHIGYEAGFGSPEHLSRTFQRTFGMSPSAYRLDRRVK